MAGQALSTGTIGPEAGRVRPARRRRLDLGRAEGRLLVRRHRDDARLHPRSRVLLHRLPHDRRGPHGLVADQLLPGREPDRPVPCPGRGDPALGPVAGRAGAAGAAHRRGPPSRSGRGCSTSAAATARPPTDATYLADLYNGTFGPWTDGPKLPAPRTGAATIFLNQSVYVIGGADAGGAPDRHRLRGHPGSRDRQARRVHRVGRPEAARGARLRIGRRRQRRPRGHRRQVRRRDRSRRSGRRPSTRPPSSASGRPRPPCRRASPRPRRPSSAITSSCSAAAIRAGRSVSSSGATWARRPPTSTRSRAGTSAAGRRTCRSPGPGPPASPRTARSTWSAGPMPPDSTTRCTGPPSTPRAT